MTKPVARYLSHPQVLIDPKVNVRRWGLSDLGRRRVTALGRSGVLHATTSVISSPETKAVETATALARRLGCPLSVRRRMHENDRSSTGFLAEKAFESAADQFFAKPSQSFRGWETAEAAQDRIVSEIMECLSDHSAGDILFVGHGAVGTLLYCHLAGLPISRAHDQIAGGGCYFEFDQAERRVSGPWKPMEDLFA